MSSSRETFDAIILGTGQAGPPLAVDLAKAGWNVAIIERNAFGGTCVNTGCIPTKTFIASARAAHVVHTAGEFGVMLDGDFRVDMKQVKARMDSVSGSSKHNENDIRKQKLNALVGTRPMTRVGRAFDRGETRGFMNVFVDAETKLILGASFFGIEADEAVHCILDTMYAKKPYTLITHAAHIHPTVSELIPTVFEDLQPLEFS